MVRFILLVMAINLRGVRESGTIFAPPTYAFLGQRTAARRPRPAAGPCSGMPPQVTGVIPLAVPPETMSVLLLARAFADGCSAMTGTEAVANGVPAFKPPEWRNAQTTMAIVAVLLATMYLGISALALVSGATPAQSGESVLSQIGRSTFGLSPMYYVLQLATMAILILAANTSFADFPRLSSILASDGFFPRQFSFRGERLAFNAGIVALALVSIVVLVVFGGNVNALIPLYAIGVFTAFTLSQAGMVRHWFFERGSGWKRSALINGFGASHHGSHHRGLCRGQVRPGRVDHPRRRPAVRPGHAVRAPAICPRDAGARRGTRPRLGATGSPSAGGHPGLRRPQGRHPGSALREVDDRGHHRGLRDRRCRPGRAGPRAVRAAASRHRVRDRGICPTGTSSIR